MSRKDQSKSKLESVSNAARSQFQPTSFLDPEKDAKLEKERKRKEREKRIKERRITLEIDPALKKLLREWSGRYGVPQSQMVMLAAIELNKLIEGDSIDIEALRSESRSPKFAYNLDLDEMIEGLKE